MMATTHNGDILRKRHVEFTHFSQPSESTLTYRRRDVGGGDEEEEDVAQKRVHLVVDARQKTCAGL